MMKKIIPIALIIVLIDQLTKIAIRSELVVGESHPVISGLFNIVYVENRGAAWGIFSGQVLPLALFGLIVLMLMLVFRKKIFEDLPAQEWVIGLLAGGIVGNVIDRIWLGCVTDFLDFHWHEVYHYPSFNIADSAICIAMALYFFSSLRHDARKKKNES